MNGQSDTNITSRTAEDNMTTVRSADQADTENADLVTDGNCFLYEDWSWDAENKYYSSQPDMQHADTGFSMAMFNSKTGLKNKLVADTPRDQRLALLVAVDVEEVRKGVVTVEFFFVYMGAQVE